MARKHTDLHTSSSLLLLTNFGYMSLYFLNGYMRDLPSIHLIVLTAKQQLSC